MFTCAKERQILVLARTPCLTRRRLDICSLNPGFPLSTMHARPSYGIPCQKPQVSIDSRRSSNLLLILLSLVVDDVEELELVNATGGGDDAEPVTELHLLEELLGPVSQKSNWLAPAWFQTEVSAYREWSRARENVQVLEVAARELIVGNDLNLAIADLGDLDGLAEVADAALNLDLLGEELLEGRDVEDLVAGGLRSVDNELLGDLGGLALGRLLL